MKRNLFCTLLALWAVTGAAGAQPPPNPGLAADGSTRPSEVTVTGLRLWPGPRLPDKVSQFSRSHGAVARNGHLSRWSEHDPVCPSVEGLPAAFESFVAARIRALAKQVGAPVDASPRCRPTIEVMFLSAPQDFVDKLKRSSRENLLGFHFAADADRIATMKYPIQAWYLTATRNDHGLETIDEPDGSPLARTFGRVGGPQALMDAGREPPHCINSRIADCISSGFKNILIVADLRKISNTPIGPVADQIAMMSLSQAAEMGRCDELPSILDLQAECGGGAKPTAVTENDLAYLRALYATDPEVPDRFAARDMEDAMLRSLRAGAPAPIAGKP